MSWPITLANAPRGTRFLAIVGMLIVVGAWMIRRGEGVAHDHAWTMHDLGCKRGDFVVPQTFIHANQSHDD